MDPKHIKSTKKKKSTEEEPDKGKRSILKATPTSS